MSRVPSSSPPSPTSGAHARCWEALVERATRGDVALTGPAGVGKSTLLRRWRERLTQGASSAEVVWIDGARHASLREALAHALHVPTERDESDEAMEARVVSALRARQGLHVLIDHADALGAPADPLLHRARASAPQARWALACEQPPERAGLEALPVALMTLPEPGADDADVLASEAVQCLLSHAPINLAHHTQAARLGDIARALDGLPGALAVAGATLELLSPQALHALLEDREARGQALSEGFGALHEALRLSFAQLTEAQRELLLACALFEDHFTIDALAATLGRSTISLYEPLQRLCDRHLVTRHDAGDGPRLRLLWSTRAFCESRGDETGHAARWRQRLVAHYATLAMHALERADGEATQLEPMLGREQAHLMSALRWLEQAQVSGPEADTWHAQLLMGLILVRWQRGDFRQLPPLERALRARVATGALTRPTLLRAQVLLHHVDCFRWEQSPKDLPPALVAQLEALPDDEQLKLQACRAALLVSSAPAQALALVEAWLPVAERLGQQRDMLRLLMVQIAVSQEAGEHHVCAGQAQAALSLARELQDWSTQARALTYLGFSRQGMFQHERAAHALREAAQLVGAHDHALSHAQTLRVLSWFLIDEAMIEEASQTLEQLLQLSLRHGLTWGLGITYFLLAQVQLDQGAIPDALAQLSRAQSHFEREARSPMLIAITLYQAITIALSERPQEAAALCDEAYAQRDALRSPIARTHLACTRAIFLTRADELEAAQALLDEAQAAIDPAHHLLECAMITLHQCFPIAARLRATHKRPQVNTLTRALIARISQLATRGAERARAPLQHSLELRLGMRLLRQDLPPQLSARLDVLLRDPEHEALIIDPAHVTFRLPHQVDWVELGRRHTPMRLLAALARHRLDAPGQPVDPDLLCALTWPGELLTVEAAHNRLHVTLSTLRREGLRELILTTERGHLLDPLLPVLLL